MRIRRERELENDTHSLKSGHVQIFQVSSFYFPFFLLVSLLFDSATLSLLFFLLKRKSTNFERTDRLFDERGFEVKSLEKR